MKDFIILALILLSAFEAYLIYRQHDMISKCSGCVVLKWLAESEDKGNGV